MEFIIPIKAPFSLSSIINSHGWIQLVPFHYEKESLEFSYIAKLTSGAIHELTIQEFKGGIKVLVTGEITQSEQTKIKEILAWMLGLDLDLSPFYQIAKHEPKLAHTSQKAAGRILRSATLFEDTIKTILTTNTAWSGTKRMVQNIVMNYGDPLPFDQTRQAFPTPDQLAISDEETLRSHIRLGYRAPYILELARSIDSGEFDLESLKTSDLPTPELRKRLLEIKGVGDYAAANLLMILARYDYLPIDSWALKVVSYEWYGGEPIGKLEVEQAFERWGKWKGLAYWFWDWDYKG